MVADIGPLVDDRQFFAVQATTKVGGTLGVKLYRVTERAGLDDSVEVSGSGAGDRFGEAIASRFDADGDGFSDLAIGAPGAGADDLIAGAVYAQHAAEEDALLVVALGARTAGNERILAVVSCGS